MTMETNNQTKSSSTPVDSKRISAIDSSVDEKVDGSADNEDLNNQTRGHSLITSRISSRGSASNSNKPMKKPPGEIDPSEYEDKEDEEENTNNDDEVLDLTDASDYNVSQRNALFQKGILFEKNGKPDLALKCYLACMKGLKNKTRFVLLPECLKNIADIYQAKGEFDKAIHFAQAEKLFYETALIETQEIQRQMEDVAGDLNVDISIHEDMNDLNLQAMRAEEYEHLARLCVDNNQSQLAMEYAGKSAKIKQKIYGSNHVKTRETLDFFASLYAEVGKEQYSDSITMMSESMEGRVDADEVSVVVPEVVMSSGDSGEPVSILRQRSSQQMSLRTKSSGSHSDKEKKQVRFHESVDDCIRRKRKEEIISLTVTLLLLLVCFFILASLGLWLYCSLDRVQSCPAVIARLKSWLMTIQYSIHRLTANTSPKTEYSR